MQPFDLNSSDRIVLPSNFVPELDFSVIESFEQLDRVIRRDFEMKAPTATEIVARVDEGAYSSRYDLLRDLALHLFWTNRFAMTMYEKRPTRWRDVPRSRDDVFLPILAPWEDGDRKIAAVHQAYEALSPRWDGEVEDEVFRIIFDVFAHKRHLAAELPAIKPTVEEILSDPGNLTHRLTSYDPDYPVYSYGEILDCNEAVPELEALHRWGMVLHNEYPWDRSRAGLAPVGELRDEDYVVVFHPRTQQVRTFLRRLSSDRPSPPRPPAWAPVDPVRPYPAVHVPSSFSVMPRIEALAAVHGEQPCTNDDIIRNSAYNWSPMGADEILTKTGIAQRGYTALSLEDLALQAAKAALAHARREPQEIGAVLLCTCTSSRMIPSVATWITGQLGMLQTHASYDIVAACAGLPYGLADATRLLQEVERPVLLICVEKFSDKIGNVRTSRMIFGDGAAALVVGPAPPGEPADIEYLQTYAGGPARQVNSIIWPNPAFDNNITVYGPEVKALAGRYLAQMIEEITALPDPDGEAESLLASVDLIVPHQANRTMVTKLAVDAGLSADSLYFNIEQVGNVSAASIPLAIHDAVRDGVISEPSRVFAPGFGAGAVAGYAVLRVDPRVVALRAPAEEQAAGAAPAPAPRRGNRSEDMEAAFG